MIKPRELMGPARAVVAIVAVGFSYFFIHISFFGPPISEYFKGTFILCTAALTVMVYKGRQMPVREGFSWLDEIFLFLTHTLMCAVYALGVYWILSGRTYLWSEFSGGGAGVAALLGAILGAVLYWKEATLEKITEAPLISDWLYLLAGVAPILWWVDQNVELVERVGGPVPASVVIFSGLLAAVSFEIARRVVGPVIPLIGFFFLIYTFKPIAQLPSTESLFYHDGYGLARVAEFLMLEADGMTGLIVEVFATYIVIFVILGAFLEKTGLGAILIDTTFRLTGHQTGGPGLTAVVSSGLFGMISGSGVANVVTTGTFTIPLMKRVGYSSEFAAAVEAAASTGGAYMPPIMAGGAFLIAQLTETSYFEIIKIAALPAILYYLSVGYMVYIRAVNRGLLGISTDELPPWEKILPRLHFLLPIPFMIYYLTVGDSAFLAAFKTICLIIMLKTTDLLNGIRTPWSDRMPMLFLGLSLLFGVFSYYFGLWVGAPFSWFADTLRGLNLGDALLWTVAGYILLKLGEIVLAALSASPAAAPAPAGAPAEGEEAGARAPAPFESGAILFDRLGESFKELVKVIWISLEAGAKNTLVVGCIAGVLGILLSCATQSDISGRISILLTEFSFGLLPLTIMWVIVAGYIVGMGLPITASYVVLVIFGVVALTNLGVPTLTAHLICFWVAVVSAVTPPVALAAYAASAIAVSDPLKTGFQALKLASWIFIMPFLFVYTPILLNGTTLEVSIVFIACLFGIIGWAGWLEGFFTKQTTGAERLLLFASSLCLLLPVERFVTFIFSIEGDYKYPTYVIGLLLLILTYMMQRGRREAVPQTT
jgi:TRAP transporter 4TM/12TM fusion protein